jgi:hypothetical protein
VIGVLRHIFPKQIDNAYRGYGLAIAMLVPLVLLNLIIGANSIFMTRKVAEIDGFALEAFGRLGEAAVLSMFALTGLLQLNFALLCVVVLIRYRAMLPLIYLFLLFEHVGRMVLLRVNPIERVVSEGGSGVPLNLIFLAALLIGFALSVSEKRAAS